LTLGGCLGRHGLKELLLKDGLGKAEDGHFERTGWGLGLLNPMVPRSVSILFSIQGFLTLPINQETFPLFCRENSPNIILFKTINLNQNHLGNILPNHPSITLRGKTVGI